MKEEWKLIRDCPKYEISNMGRIRKLSNGKILKSLCRNKTGPIISLDNGKQRYSIITLFTKYILPKPYPNAKIAFRDNNISNINIDNVFWYIPELLNKYDDSISIWKEIPHFSNYEASNTGYIRNKYGDMMLPKVNRLTSRYQICLSDGHNHKSYHYLSRIIAQTFLPKPRKNRTQINHKDGDYTNNNIDNLEWVSQTENMLHSTRILGNTRGENHPLAKLVEADIILIKSLYKTGQYTQKALSKKFNISLSHTNNIILNKRWNHLSNNYNQEYHS